jgi:hypothetical protein
MMFTGPEEYELSLTPTEYTLDRKFCGFACKKNIPKLYDEEIPEESQLIEMVGGPARI